MLKKTLVASLALAAFTTHAAASQSLLETYEQAVANDPQLAIAKFNVENAQQDIVSARSSVLPSVSATATYGVGSDSTEESILPYFDRQSIGATLRVQQNLFVLAAFTAYEGVKVNASIEDIKQVKAEQDLMVRVAENYINALRAKDALEVLNAQLEAVERQFEQTEQRYEVGLVTITDVLDAGATLDQTKVSLIRAESQYDIALQNVSVITGSIPEGVLSVSEALPVNAPRAEGQQQWVDYAVANHPEILEAKTQIEVGELTLKGRKEERLPSVGGSAEFSYSDVFGDAGFDNDAETNWSASFGISVNYSVFDGGAADARIAQVGIQNNILEQNIELLKRVRAVTVANLYRTVRADAQNIEAQKQALKSRESSLQATTVGYEVGTRNIVEVLNAQLAAFSAQNDLNNARYDYLLNLLKLKKEAGQLQLADLESIEEFLVQ